MNGDFLKKETSISYILIFLCNFLSKKEVKWIKQAKTVTTLVVSVFSYVSGDTTTLTLIGSKRFWKVWSKTATLTLYGTMCFIRKIVDTTAVTLIGSKCFKGLETTTLNGHGVRNGSLAPPCRTFNFQYIFISFCQQVLKSIFY